MSQEILDETAEAPQANTPPTIELVPVNALSIAGLIRNQPRWPDTDPRYRALVEDIRKNGVRNPLNVDPENVVWDGFDRLRASKAAGLKTVPVIRCTAEEGPEIAFGSLLHRKHHSKGQRVYSAYPYFIARHASAQVRNRARLQSGGADFGGDDDGVETMCAELGVSRELFYQAKRLHDIFTERPDLRDLFEERIMDDEDPISLGAAIAGVAGHLSTRGKEKAASSGSAGVKLVVFTDALKSLKKGLKAWEKIPEEHHEKACVAIRATVDAMPDGVLTEFRRAVHQTEKSRKATAKATDPSDN